MLAFHDLYEPLGERDRKRICIFAVLLEPNERQRRHARDYGESTVESVRHLAFDKPVRTPGIDRQRIEQGSAA